MLPGPGKVLKVTFGHSHQAAKSVAVPAGI
jgi:hypothetical protein